MLTHALVHELILEGENHKWSQLDSQVSLTLIGKFLRPFYWKTHPSKNHEFFLKPGRELERFTGKLIQTKCYISYMVSVKTFEWMSFPVKRSVRHPRIEKTHDF